MRRSAARMAPEAISRVAVLLDAFGTLVRMDPPGPRLREALERLSGVDVGLEAAERGFAAEIAYYLEHNVEGRDAASLETLRDRCAEVLHGALRRSGLDRGVVRRAMLESLRFEAFPDAPGALRELRARGLRLVVASNWDRSLPTVLDRVGLGELVDAVVPSAVVGAAKPDRRLFEAGLEAAGCAAGEALYAGDSVESDVEGARAAGIEAVLVDREGTAPPGVPAIRSLEDLPKHPGLLLHSNS
jgi:putative hydrolase of the HAD superfamily